MICPSNSRTGTDPAGFSVVNQEGLLLRSIRIMLTFFIPLILRARLARCVKGQSPSLLLSGDAYTVYIYMDNGQERDIELLLSKWLIN